MRTAILTEAMAPSNPLELFAAWYREAAVDSAADPTAVAVATTGSDGQPHVRMVLLKAYDSEGFVFYTNYSSDKARELAAHRHAALLFWWPQLLRQVRIEGTAAAVSTGESDAYFASRPRGSQLGAWASPQSTRIPGRAWLEAELERLDSHYAGRPVPRPPHWGGYRVRPVLFEFWQGRENRLHDRLRYTLNGAAWERVRLAP
jgi:pyridoxamine 5'-phosphate oxidase